MIDTKKSYCLRCDYETNHNILFQDDVRSNNNDYDYVVNYLVVKCMGCEKISFREEFIDLDSAYPDNNGNWEHDILIDTYPKKLRARQKLNNIWMLPKKIKTVYDESLKAFNADCFVLAGVGFRAVIEAICIEEEIRGSNLEKKINSLARQKLITEKESKRLHSIRFIGNDSVHEMKIPKPESLSIVLDIIEHLLNNIYLMDYNSSNHLETVIDKYPEFIELIGYGLQNLNSGDEVPLAKILGKNVRRFVGRLTEFESELIASINNHEYEQLSIGKIDTYGNSSAQVQHFIAK